MWYISYRYDFFFSEKFDLITSEQTCEKFLTGLISTCETILMESRLVGIFPLVRIFLWNADL